MIRGTTLYGRPVIDLDAGEHVGTLADVVLDPPSQCVAWLIVAPRDAAFSSGRLMILPAAVVHVVKPKAIMVRRADEPEGEMRQIASLPRLSHLTGRTVRNASGAVVGVLDDVLLDPQNGRILSYPLRAAHFLQTIERWLAGESAALRWDYVPGDTPLQIDLTLVIVPDDAVVHLRAQAAPRNGGRAVTAASPDGATNGLGGDDRDSNGVGGELAAALLGVDGRDASGAGREPPAALEDVSMAGGSLLAGWGQGRPLPPPRWGAISA
jgi:sporulation protein YlmC with PRC-barrel domain